MSTLFEQLRKVVTVQLGVAAEEVIPMASFVKDLGADSIELLELVMAVEEEFSSSSRKVEIPDDDMTRLITVQDAVDYLRALGIEEG